MSFTVIDLTIPSTPESPTRIYWDEQDPQDQGPAWWSDGDSGRLEFHGWSDGSDGDGRELWMYFEVDYKGPDSDGVYPILKARE